ncbi:amidase [Corynebacterium sp. Marseille-P4321]|uniref:amidase family protein n=1 Tax=Corynebacterium sp. Marseille-P4321 TaxID=2736603 RepID=UPI0020CA4124|nr:amidase [Corynebacterium sp. Marseille-P4321]
MLHPAFTHVIDPPLTGPTGRLSGWSIPVKDGTDIAGVPTTHGNPARAYVAEKTDPFVQLLLELGATVPAKTLTSELGATCYAEREGVPVLESPAHPGCTPGGSSAGAAVVVADGTVRAAHGTDAGGSIRVPAAACEVVGLKLGSSRLAAHGFLTRSVADQRELLGLPSRGMRRLKIGVLTEGLFARPDLQDSRGAAVERAAAKLSQHHEVVQVRPYPGSLETYAHFTTAITHAFRNVDPRDSAYIAWLVERALQVTPAQVEAARSHARELPGLLARPWGVDVLLSPTLAYDPPALGHFPAMAPEDSFHAQTDWSPWCSLFNVLRTPAIALGPVHLGAVTVSVEELVGVAELVDKQ